MSVVVTSEKIRTIRLGLPGDLTVGLLREFLNALDHHGLREETPIRVERNALNLPSALSVRSADVDRTEFQS